jgi:2-polyprenyl-6-methoxyphenol hydroxylase-like FAD-dependent oxidoreductase
MLLARAGHRVLLVDHATFPSDTNSTHYVQQPAVARLRDWGLLDAVIATGCPPVTTYGLDFGAFALRGRPTPYDGVAVAYGPRRVLLDAILLEAAASAGATVETGFFVDGLLFDDGAVAGIRGRTEDGNVVQERAQLVVGADGLRSAVATAVDAAVYDDRGALECAYYTYWSGVPTVGMDCFVREGTGAAAIPTNDGLTCIPVVWPREQFSTIRADVEAHYFATLDQTPLGEPARAGAREDRWHAVPELPNFFRAPAGPGWALVGDAGYHQDPITAHGITNAFRDAELLATAASRGLAGEVPMSDALAQYHRERDEAARPMFELTCQVAAPGPPPPEFVALLQALQGNEPATDRWFGVMAGTVEPDVFFAPDSIAAIMAAAAESHAAVS